MIPMTIIDTWIFNTNLYSDLFPAFADFMTKESECTDFYAIQPDISDHGIGKHVHHVKYQFVFSVPPVYY